MILITILLLILGVVIWFKVKTNYSYPINHVNLFSISWLLILIGSLIFPLEVNLRFSTINLLLLAWIFFLLGSYKIKLIEFDCEYLIDYNLDRLKIVLYILVLLSFFAYLVNLKEMIAQITSIESWANVRTDKEFDVATKENIIFTLFARNYSIYVPIAIFLLIKEKISLIQFVLIFAFGLLTSVINFTRAPLLELLVVSLVCFLLLKKTTEIPIVKVVIIAFTLFLVFIISQSILVSDTKDFSDVFYQIKLYLFGGVNNFQILFDGNYPEEGKYSSSFYSLDFINYVLQRLGLIDSYPALIREWNYITDSNVYTFLDCFTLDFGIFGILIGSYLIGYIGRIVYFQFIKTLSLSSLVVYGLICYYLIMSFMNNEFIRFSFFLFIVKIFIIDLIARNHKFKFKW